MFKVGDLVQRISGEWVKISGNKESFWAGINFKLAENQNKIQTYTKEELSHIDELEDRISMLEDLCMEYAKLLDKKEPTYFKPICDMTIADWKKAKEEMWVFQLGSGEQLVVKLVESDDYNHPIQMSNFEWYTVDGQMALDESIQKENIVKRVK